MSYTTLSIEDIDVPLSVLLAQAMASRELVVVP
jgi:hypothetical protein